MDAGQFRPDSLLTDDAILEAGHALYASAFENECDERGIKNTPPGRDICDYVEQASPAVIRPIVWYYIGRISQSWGQDVGLVFHHMGITENEQGSALWNLLAGCQGHGVSLEDEHGDALDRASETLGSHFNSTPIHDEMDVFLEVALEAVNTEYPDSVRS